MRCTKRTFLMIWLKYLKQWGIFIMGERGSFNTLLFHLLQPIMITRNLKCVFNQENPKFHQKEYLLIIKDFRSCNFLDTNQHQCWMVEFDNVYSCSQSKFTKKYHSWSFVSTKKMLFDVFINYFWGVTNEGYGGCNINVSFDFILAFIKSYSIWKDKLSYGFNSTQAE